MKLKTFNKRSQFYHSATAHLLQSIMAPILRYCAQNELGLTLSTCTESVLSSIDVTNLP